MRETLSERWVVMGESAAVGQLERVERGLALRLFPHFLLATARPYPLTTRSSAPRSRQARREAPTIGAYTVRTGTMRGVSRASLAGAKPRRGPTLVNGALNLLTVNETWEYEVCPMLSSKRICNDLCRRPRRAAGWLLRWPSLVGGCSADVTRFDFPVFGLTEQGQRDRVSADAAGVGGRSDRGYDDARAPPRGAGLSDSRPRLHAAALHHRLQRQGRQRPRLRAAARRRATPRAPSATPVRRSSARRRRAAARGQRRDHPGAAGRYALRHRQALRRVDLAR